MMDYPLLLRTFLLRAAKYFPKKELVSILNIKPAEIESKMGQKYPLIKRELSVEEYTALTATNLPGTVFLPGYKRLLMVC